MTASKAFRYEVRMLRHCAQRLAVSADDVERNAYLESFLIHARALVKTLFDEPLKPRDVVASDFFSDPKKWPAIRGDEKPKDLDIVERIGREVAHITLAREWEQTCDKDWHVAVILQELLRLVRRFNAAQPDRWHREYAETDDVPFVGPPVDVPVATSTNVGPSGMYATQNLDHYADLRFLDDADHSHM